MPATILSSLNAAPEPRVQPPRLTTQVLFAFQAPADPCQTNCHNAEIAEKLPDDAEQDTTVGATVAWTG